MQLKHIKQCIKNKRCKNGNKNKRDNKAIFNTLKQRYQYALEKHKQALSDSIKDTNITQDLQKTIYRKAKKAGLSKQQIQKIGCLKLLQLLK